MSSVSVSVYMLNSLDQNAKPSKYNNPYGWLYLELKRSITA